MLTPGASLSIESQNEVCVLANPIAGRSASRQNIDAFVTAALSYGLKPIVCNDLGQVRDVLHGRADAIRCAVSAGGDGTFNCLINLRPTSPVAVLPLGNENLVAKHFGFSRYGRVLARDIVAGDSRTIDIGVANGKRFAIMASAGFDADVVERVHRHRDGYVSKRHYAWQMLQAGRNYRFPSIRVQIRDTGECLAGALVFLFNLPRYGLGIPIAMRADTSDGLLDLFVFEKPGMANLAFYLGAVALRGHMKLDDVQHRRVREVRLECDAAVPLQVDGDPARNLPATISVLPAELRVLTPVRSGRSR